jgi:hypothetical protein
MRISSVRALRALCLVLPLYSCKSEGSTPTTTGTGDDGGVDGGGGEDGAVDSSLDAPADGAGHDADSSSVRDAGDASDSAAGEGGPSGDAAPQACTPFVVTNEVGPFGNEFYGFATDGTNVYWSDYVTNDAGAPVDRVMAVPVDGGAATMLGYSTQCTGGYDDEFAITVSDAGVFWNIGGTLWRVPKEAGAAPAGDGTPLPAGGAQCAWHGGTPLAASTTGTYAQGVLASDETNIYSFGGANGPLEKVPVDGSPSSVIAMPGSYVSVATDGTNVYYWASGGTGQLMSAPVSGSGAASTIATTSGGTPGFSLAVTGGLLYWSDLGASPPDILRVPVGGGTPTVLASGDPLVQNREFVAVDGMNVYWVGGDGAGTVTRVSVSGGTPVSIAATPTPCGGSNRNCAQIAVDGTSVYWMNLPYVYKCPK